jgi:hypothetical protein
MGISEATATAACGVGLGALGVVLGQAAIPESAPSWLNAGGGLVSLGFAVWYAWWVTTKTIPERDKVHAETITGLVKEFRDEAKEQRQIHSAAVDKIDSSMDRLSTVIERALQK